MAPHTRNPQTHEDLSLLHEKETTNSPVKSIITQAAFLLTQKQKKGF